MDDSLLSLPPEARARIALSVFLATVALAVVAVVVFSIAQLIAYLTVVVIVAVVLREWWTV